MEHEQPQQQVNDTPPMTDQEVVAALKEQRASHPETEGEELPPSAESGERVEGEMYMTSDDRIVRHEGYEDVDGEQVPIATDVTHGRRYNDGSIYSNEPAQLHDDYYVTDKYRRDDDNSMHRVVQPRLTKDEAYMAADIMKHKKRTAEILVSLDEAVQRRKEILQEIKEAQAAYEAMQGIDEDDFDSKEAEQKRVLRHTIFDLKHELRRLGRPGGDTYNSHFYEEYSALDREAESTDYNYITKVFQLNPNYFKDMPTQEFVEIGNQLAQLEQKTGAYSGLDSPTEPGSIRDTDLLAAEIRRRKEAGEAVPRDEYETREETYTCLEYLNGRIEAGNQMVPDDFVDLLEKYVDVDMLDDDVYSEEDLVAFKEIEKGFYDRPPRETYQMYVEVFQKIGEAVKEQRERNQKKYEDFLEDLKSRAPETISAQ